MPLDGYDIRSASLLSPPLRNGVGEHTFFPLPYRRKMKGHAKDVLVLSTMAAALLLVSGVALADHLVNTVYCPADEFGYCEGTEESDHIYGTDTRDYIYTLGGDD